MPITGKFLSCTINGTVLAGTHEWSVQETADRLDATTGANNGRGRKEAGVIDTRIRVTFYLDITSGLFTAVRPGTVLTNLRLFTRSAASNPVYLFSSATVFDMTVRGQVRDRFVVDCDIEPAGDVITATEPN